MWHICRAWVDVYWPWRDVAGAVEIADLAVIEDADGEDVDVVDVITEMRDGWWCVPIGRANKILPRPPVLPNTRSFAEKMTVSTPIPSHDA
jgi:hypothetical protein